MPEKDLFDEKTASEVDERFKSNAVRMFFDGVVYTDFLKIWEKTKTLDEWCSKWMEEASVHKKLAEEALSEGNTVTAGESFWRASLYYHYAQFLEWHKPIKQEAVKRKVEAYKRGAPLFAPPAERIEISAPALNNITLPGYLRIPLGKENPPIVLLIGGLESTKEEYYAFEKICLRRGLATFAFDGPGQCEVYYQMKSRPDFEKATSAVIDGLQNRKEFDIKRLGVLGRSLGGYLALRSAAFDKRIKACVANSSVDFEKTWDSHKPGMKDGWTYVSEKKNWDEAKEYFKSYTLKGVAHKITCPTYILQGEKDPICPPEWSEWVTKEIKGPVKLAFVKGAGHCAHEFSHIYWPQMADWLAETIGA